MSGLTVACVFVRGHVPFTAEYVTRLKSMAARMLPSHNFVCLTDRESELPLDVVRVRVDHPRGIFGWWSKIELFNPKYIFRERVLYLDLDTVLLKGMEEIVNFPAPLALIPDGAPNFSPSDRSKSVVKRFNSSVMVWDHGTHPEIYDSWAPRVADRLWGDQDWIGELLPSAKTMPLEWFPRISQLKIGPLGTPVYPDEAKVLLCKKPKNLDAVKMYPWFKEVWQ